MDIILFLYRQGINMKFLVQKIDNKLTLDFCHELMVSQIYAKWRGDDFSIKYANDGRVPEGIKRPQQYIPVGTVEFVRGYINKYFPNNTKGLIPINVPDCLKTYAGRYVWDIDCKEAIPDALKPNDNVVYSSPIWHEDEMTKIGNEPMQLFRKSLTKIKDETNGFIDYDVNNANDINKIVGYQVSTSLNGILSEWRVFVYHNKVQQVCYYDGDPLVFPDAYRIKKMVERYGREDAPVAYTLDVCVTEGSTYVMEVHRFFSCGLYGFADYRVLPYMFSQSWHEMMYLK